jgi:hypothetical protein
MSPSHEPQFKWRGVILIAIAFAFFLPAAASFRGGGPPSGPVNGQPTPIDSGHVLSIVGGSILFALVALLGGYCGYLRVISRIRKDSEAPHSPDTGPKT